MPIFMIGTIKNKNNLIGIRLLESTTGQVKDADINSVIKALKAGTKIENLMIDGNELKGINGSIERYGVIGKSQSCTILGLHEDASGNIIGYRVADVNGCVKDLDIRNTIDIAERLGLANGRVVEKNGKKFISPIFGGYEVIKKDNTSKNIKNIIANKFINITSCYKISDEQVLIIEGKLGDYKIWIYDIKKDYYNQINTAEDYFGYHRYQNKHYIALKKYSNSKEALIEILKVNEYGYNVIESFEIGKSYGHFNAVGKDNCYLVLCADNKETFYNAARVIDLVELDKSGEILSLTACYSNSSFTVDGKIISIRPPHYKGRTGQVNYHIQFFIDNFNISWEGITCEFSWRYINAETHQVVKIDDCDKIGIRYRYGYIDGTNGCKTRLR